MKAVTKSPLSIVLMTVMSVALAGTAMAAPPKTLSKVHQPSGKPTKASSFAPHPTKSRAFGAPIQAPILKSAPPKKKPAPK